MTRRGAAAAERLEWCRCPWSSTCRGTRPASARGATAVFAWPEEDREALTSG
ncbi:hypothetical protein [Actinophytocola sp.]|uniref:hypothetical protein n=1 Tax=Actinophytocola sp. TaxID=1872138 RepID=UPI0039C8BDF3